MDTDVEPARSGSWRKHLFWIIPAAVVVLFAGGWLGVTFAVENTVRRCLADASSRLIGQEVEPDEVSCSLVLQELCIRGIRVKNPPGYSDQPAIRVDLVSVRVNPLAFLFERVVHLKKLTVSGVRINAELKEVPATLKGWLDQLGNPEINLLELKRSRPVAERRTVRSKKRSGSRKAKKPLKFRLDELRVEKSAVSLSNFDALLFPGWSTFSLDSYEQKDLGREKPLTADELAAEIFNRHWEDIKQYLKDKKDRAAARWKSLFRKKSKKEKPAEIPAPPVQPEDEAAKKKNSEARKQLLKGAGRAAVDLAEVWLKKKQKQMEEEPSAPDDPEAERKQQRNKRLVDLGLQAADAAREGLAESPAKPAPMPAPEGNK